MENDDLTREDILVEEALNDLISLNEENKNKIKFERKVKKENKIKKPLKPVNGLQAIIDAAIQEKQSINKDMWDDPNKKVIENIRNKTKAQGKSEYDSDVLRQRILEKQREKRRHLYEGTLTDVHSLYKNDKDK